MSARICLTAHLFFVDSTTCVSFFYKHRGFFAFSDVAATQKMSWVSSLNIFVGTMAMNSMIGQPDNEDKRTAMDTCGNASRVK